MVAQVGWGAAGVVVWVEDVEVDGFVETALVVEAEVTLEVVGVDGVVAVEDVEEEEEREEIIEGRAVEELPTLTSAFLYQFAGASPKHTPTGTAVIPISAIPSPCRSNQNPNLPFQP